MKKLNSIVLLAFGIMAYAQPSVTRAGVDRINNPIELKSGDVTATAINAGPAGANITWDFSAYAGTNTITYTVNACPGQANCFRFPGANRITKPASADTYDFNIMTDADATMIGSYSGPTLGDITVTYTNPLIEYKFPITYLQQYSDNYQFSSVSASVGNTDESGQVDYSVDGYGTVITPAGTFTNVLRIKRMRTATQTFPGVPTPVTYTNESYQWVNQSYGTVFTFGINTFVFNGTTNVAKTVSYLTNGTLSAIEADAKKVSVSVYPNPGSDFITLNAREDIRSIKVTSMDGTVVLTVGNVKTVDISKLPKGVYILQGELKNGGSVSKKIIKK